MPARRFSAGFFHFRTDQQNHKPHLADNACMAERRQNTRFKALGLTTPFGDVLDISDSGIGLFRKGRMQLSLGDTVTLELRHEGVEISLTAKVVRIDPAGLFRHEIGFEFVEIEEETRIKIRSLAHSACSEFASPRCWVAA